MCAAITDDGPEIKDGLAENTPACLLTVLAASLAQQVRARMRDMATVYQFI